MLITIEAFKGLERSVTVSAWERGDRTILQ